MKKILKYKLPECFGESFNMMVPFDLNPLRVEWQTNENEKGLYLWASSGDPETQTLKANFIWVATGQKYDSAYSKHVGTIVTEEKLVFHLLCMWRD